MTTLISERDASAMIRRRTGIIDYDVHSGSKSAAEIKEDLPMPFRDRWNEGGGGFFGNPVHGARLDSNPPGGRSGNGPRLFAPHGKGNKELWRI